MAMAKRLTKLKSGKLFKKYLRNVEKLVKTVSKLRQSAKRLEAEIKDTRNDIHRTRQKYKALAAKQQKGNQTGFTSRMRATTMAL